MIRNLKPYPAYKDSGVPWLGQVPISWTVQRLNASVADVVAGTWGTEPSGKDDAICVRVADFDRSRLRVRVDRPTIRAIAPADLRRKRLTRGDLLLEKSGGGDLQPVGVVMLFDHEEVAVCSNFVARMSVTTGFEPEFLTYLHTTLYSIGLNVRSIKQTTGIQNLDCRAYLSESVAFPPLSEQVAIVRYLDHMDRKVRHVIRARQQLIKLLTEQKQAIINRAVTRGLDPSVPLKPSGVPWLGDVPEHWAISRVKDEFNCLDRRRIPLSGVERGAMSSQQYDYYGASGIIDKVADFLFDDELLLIAEDGANLVLRNLPLAIIARGKFWVNNHAHILKPKQGNIEYLSAVMEMLNYQPWISGAAQPKLTQDRLMSIALAIPPRDEQDQIIANVQEKTVSLRHAIDAAHREINLLREYRTRLIADVVTGKLDVRDVKVPDDETYVLPEEIERIDDVDTVDQTDDVTEGNSESSTEETA